MYDVDRTVATLVLLVSQKYCIGSNDPQIIYQYIYNITYVYTRWTVDGYKVDIHYILVSHYCSAREKSPLPHITWQRFQENRGTSGITVSF